MKDSHLISPATSPRQNNNPNNPNNPHIDTRSSELPPVTADYRTPSRYDDDVYNSTQEQTDTYKPPLVTSASSPSPSSSLTSSSSTNQTTGPSGDSKPVTQVQTQAPSKSTNPQVKPSSNNPKNPQNPKNPKNHDSLKELDYEAPYVLAPLSKAEEHDLKNALKHISSPLQGPSVPLGIYTYIYI